MQFYLNSKHQFLEAEELLSAGFDVQWVSNLLHDSISRAGFTPCLSIDQLHLKDNSKEVVHALKISNSQQFIQVSRMSENFTPLVRIQNATQIVALSRASLNKKHPLLIADCHHAEIHHVIRIEKHFRGVLITLDKPLQFSYSSSTYVGEYIEERWLIKKNKDKKNALHYQVMHAEELTSLIHFLNVTSKNTNGKEFVEVILGLSGDKIHKLSITVRGS